MFYIYSSFILWLAGINNIKIIVNSIFLICSSYRALIRPMYIQCTFFTVDQTDHILEVLMIDAFQPPDLLHFHVPKLFPIKN